jgi:hypothetical protein
MSTEKIVMNALFGKTELATQKIELNSLQDLMAANEDLEQGYILAFDAKKTADKLLQDLKNEKNKSISAMQKYKKETEDLGLDGSKNIFYTSIEKLLQNNLIKSL